MSEVVMRLRSVTYCCEVIKMPSIVLVSISCAALLAFAVSFVLRARTKGRYEIKVIDLTVAAIPLLVWFLSTGQVQKIALGGVSVELAEVFAEATDESVGESVIRRDEAVTVEELVQYMRYGPKDRIGSLDKLALAETEALEFGFKDAQASTRYGGSVIKEYFDQLASIGSLKYAVIYNKPGELFGFYDIKTLLLYFRVSRADERPLLERLLRPAEESDELKRYNAFASMLNGGRETDRERLRNLPGFYPGLPAIREDTTRRDALRIMDEQGCNRLPVIDDDGRFVGVVERSALTAAMLLHITETLEERSNR